MTLARADAAGTPGNGRCDEGLKQAAVTGAGAPAPETREAGTTSSRPERRRYPASIARTPAASRSTARRAAGTMPAKSAKPWISASSSISVAATPAARSADA